MWESIATVRALGLAASTGVLAQDGPCFGVPVVAAILLNKSADKMPDPTEVDAGCRVGGVQDLGQHLAQASSGRLPAIDPGLLPGNFHVMGANLLVPKKNNTLLTILCAARVPLGDPSPEELVETSGFSLGPRALDSLEQPRWLA